MAAVISKRIFAIAIEKRTNMPKKAISRNYAPLEGAREREQKNNYKIRT